MGRAFGRVGLGSRSLRLSDGVNVRLSRYMCHWRMSPIARVVLSISVAALAGRQHLPSSSDVLVVQQFLATKRFGGL